MLTACYANVFAYFSVKNAHLASKLTVKQQFKIACLPKYGMVAANLLTITYTIASTASDSPMTWWSESGGLEPSDRKSTAR